MNNAFVGDIGDFGKYGLLREFGNTDLSLAVNWYKTDFKTTGGGFLDYLDKPEEFESYDKDLFWTLHKIVCIDKDRRIERIEEEGLFDAVFFHEPIRRDRRNWWENALAATSDVDVVFLDPDNGLETARMQKMRNGSPRHVRWIELREYYQDACCSVIMYQHRPQGESEEDCKKRVLGINDSLIYADYVHILDFPRRTNRYYFFFTHKEHEKQIENLCKLMDTKWNGICAYKEKRY